MKIVSRNELVEITGDSYRLLDKPYWFKEEIGGEVMYTPVMLRTVRSMFRKKLREMGVLD